MEVKLVIISPAKQRSEYKLRLPAIIGRGRDANLKLVHPLISRRHCELFEAEGQLFVRDLGSMNGIQIGNQRITTEAPLPPGELLTIGAVTFQAIYTPDASAPAAAKLGAARGLTDTHLAEDTIQPLASPTSGSAAAPAARDSFDLAWGGAAESPNADQSGLPADAPVDEPAPLSFLDDFGPPEAPPASPNKNKNPSPAPPDEALEVADTCEADPGEGDEPPLAPPEAGEPVESNLPLSFLDDPVANPPAKAPSAAAPPPAAKTDKVQTPVQPPAPPAAEEEFLPVSFDDASEVEPETDEIVPPPPVPPTREAEPGEDPRWTFLPGGAPSQGEAPEGEDDNPFDFLKGAK